MAHARLPKGHDGKADLVFEKDEPDERQESLSDNDEPDDEALANEIYRATEKDEGSDDQAEDEDEKLAASIFSAAGGETKIPPGVEGIRGPQRTA